MNGPTPKRPSIIEEGTPIKQVGRLSDTDALIVLEDGRQIRFHAKYVYDQMDGGEAVLVIEVT